MKYVKFLPPLIRWLIRMVFAIPFVFMIIFAWALEEDDREYLKDAFVTWFKFW
jgi:hypothetical protein